MKKSNPLTFKEKWEISAFLIFGIICATADSPNTYLWFACSILGMGGVCIVPLLYVRRQSAKVSRKLRAIRSMEKSQGASKRAVHRAG